ncbi:MAG TPA: CoA transferase [Solirubrobacterales bacterium]
MNPLDGITVLDFSRVLAGPMATQILAELGAEVIKVERPRVGDETRRFEPLLDGGESAYFFAFNRGKRSVTLDLRQPRGRELARRLSLQADVVVENHLPGRMKDLGLDYETLSADHPALVYVSTTGFGLDGPDKDRKGYDTVFQALSGTMSLTGHPDGPPAKAGFPAADMTSGLWIVIAALAGLAGRAATGRGRHFDLAMMDVQISLLALAAARVFALDEEPTRTGTEHPGRVPSAAFECAGGEWLHISGSDQHWAGLCETLGLADLAADESLARNRGRVEQRERVMASLREAIARRDRGSLVAELRAVGVPAGEVRSVKEALGDPQTVAREMVGEFTHPGEGAFPALRTPLRAAGSPPPAVSSPPLLGADTEEVLGSILGIGPREIEALREEGTI